MLHRLKYTLLLILTAFIWGVAFVAQSEGGSHMGAATFNCIRFLIASATLVPVILFRKNRKGRQTVTAAADQEQKSIRKADTAEVQKRKAIRKAGAVCGIALAAASYLQQAGITLGTPAGKAGFLTAVYIVIVPLISSLLFRRKVSAQIWLGVGLTLVGLYLLCLTGSASLQMSDLLVLLSAFAFAVQILTVDHYAAYVDTIRMSAFEFLVCGLLSAVIMFFSDVFPRGLYAWSLTLSSADAWIPLLYAGVLSGGVAYTLQAVAQKEVPPTLASLLMSLESVFSALAGWAILHQAMSRREILGSVLVFAAIIIAQLPLPEKRAQK